MRMFEPSKRIEDNKNLIKELKHAMGEDLIDGERITNSLLSDISISLAMIAELLNYRTKINKGNEVEQCQ